MQEQTSIVPFDGLLFIIFIADKSLFATVQKT